MVSEKYLQFLSILKGPLVSPTLQIMEFICILSYPYKKLTKWTMRLLRLLACHIVSSWRNYWHPRATFLISSTVAFLLTGNLVTCSFFLVKKATFLAFFSALAFCLASFLLCFILVFFPGHKKSFNWFNFIKGLGYNWQQRINYTYKSTITNHDSSHLENSPSFQI